MEFSAAGTWKSGGSWGATKLSKLSGGSALSRSTMLGASGGLTIPAGVPWPSTLAGSVQLGVVLLLAWSDVLPPSSALAALLLISAKLSRTSGARRPWTTGGSCSGLAACAPPSPVWLLTPLSSTISEKTVDACSLSWPA